MSCKENVVQVVQKVAQLLLEKATCIKFCAGLRKVKSGFFNATKTLFKKKHLILKLTKCISTDLMF